MNQKEMINKCKEIGLNVTPPLIYRQGKKYGFLIRNKSDGRERYNMNEDKFNEWLSNFTVSNDYLPVGETARQNNIPYSGLKYQLEKNNCEIKKLGIIRGGLLYARRTDIERAIASYCKRSKE